MPNAAPARQNTKMLHNVSPAHQALTPENNPSPSSSPPRSSDLSADWDEAMFGTRFYALARGYRKKATAGDVWSLQSIQRLW